MTEDKFEDFLKKTAPGYNAPPARVPREEMWQAIQATRNAGPRVVYGGSPNYGATPGRFSSKVWWAAAAAVVLVAGGIGIGRWTASPGTAVNTAGSNRETPSDGAALTDPALPSGSDDQPGQLAEGGASPIRGATERVAAPAASVASSNVAARNGASAGSATAPDASSSAYQAVATSHLTRAEALLTSFRTRSTADQRVDAQLASWARELLTNTRLIMDSPVGLDPLRRPLLEDLELLLVQIVQLSPGSTPEDREIIEKTLRQDQVLTKLRAAIPAGQRGS